MARIQPAPESEILKQLNAVLKYQARVKGGRTQGRLNAENKTGICGLTKEQRQETGRRSNLKMPRELRVLGGQRGGRRTFEKGTGIFGISPEQHSENSRQMIAAHPEMHSIGGKVMGPIQGAINAKTPGRMLFILHCRHHVKAGKTPIKPCLFCQLGEEAAWKEYQRLQTEIQ
jgi:hypothetical protein